MPIVNEKKLDECKYEIAFTYDADKVSTIVDEVAREIGKHHKIPGSRPGKASLEAVKIAARKNVLDAASNKLLNEAYQDILHEKNWKAFTQPQVDGIEIAFNRFSAKITIGHMPDISLTTYKDIELITPENLPNKETLFEKFVENVCSNFASKKPFGEDDFLLAGDSAVINFDGTIDGKTFDKNKGEGVLIEIGKGQAIDGFEENLIGMKAGEKREFEIKFDSKAPTSELIDKTVKFNVELVSGAKKEPATFDEELAKKLNFQTLDQLKEDIDKKVEEYKKEMLFNVLKTTVADKLVDLNSFEIPQWMIASTAEQTSTMQDKSFANLTVEEKEAMFKETTRNIKLSFILEKIKELEVETALSQQELMKILDNNVGKLPDNIRHELIEGKNMALYAKLLNDIQIEYVLKWVIDHSKISESKKGE